MSNSLVRDVYEELVRTIPKNTPSGTPQEMQTFITKEAEKAAQKYLRDHPPSNTNPEQIRQAVQQATEQYLRDHPIGDVAGEVDKALKKTDPGIFRVSANPEEFQQSLQVALNSADVKVIALPAGEYQLANSISLDKAHGKTLVGKGESTIIKAAKNSGKNGFQATSGGNLTDFCMSDFVLDMQWSEGDTSANGIQITNAKNITIERITVKNSGGGGILLQGHGKTNGNGVTRPIVRDVKIHKAGLKQNPESRGASGHGIQVKGNSPYATIEGCQITGVSCGMGVSIFEDTQGTPTFFKIAGNTIIQGDNETIAFEPIGCTKNCHYGIVANNNLPISRDNGISIGGFCTVIGNTIGEAWNHGIAVSGAGTTVTGNVIRNVGKENFTRLRDRPAAWAAITFEDPKGCVAANNIYQKTDEESSCTHMVKVNIGRNTPRDSVGGNVFIGNTDPTGGVTGTFIHNANFNPANPDTIDDAKALDGKIESAVDAAVKKILTVKPTAIEKWIDPDKRYYTPVTYWWADLYLQTSNWHHLFDVIDTIPFLIFNPKSGPGTQVEPDFTTLRNKIRGYGKPIIGYVRTTETFSPRTTRSKETIIGELRKHIEYYAVDGVFLDEMVNGWPEEQQALIPFYKDLYKTIKKDYGEDFLIVGNPGANTREELLECADILMTFEQNAEKYLNDTESPVTPDHYKKYPPYRFIHAIHNITTPEQLRKVLRKSEVSNVAMLYATTDTFTGVLGSESEDNNPWDNKPADWCVDMQVAWARRQEDIAMATNITSPNREDTKNQIVRTGEDGFIHCDSGPWDNPHLANKSYVDWMVNSRSNAMIRVVPSSFSDFKHDHKMGTGSLFIILPEEEGGVPTFKWVPKTDA